MEEEKRVNLGCGRDIKEGWMNYDKYPKSKKVKYIDLDQLPLPFKKDSVDYIYMCHVFEHLIINRQDFMEDVHRILKVGGVVEINVPRYHNRVIHTIGFFPMAYFDSICRDSLRSWKFEMVSKEYLCDGSLFGKLFKIFPIVERLFPFMFNGSIVWKLRKVRNDG